VRARFGYLARVGKQLLPKVFHLADQTVFFTGDGPYEAQARSWCAGTVPTGPKRSGRTRKTRPIQAAAEPLLA
jgi:hypothetical protein